MRVPAKWTNDCQGKKDYDGELVTLSTRYWPEGGGFHVRTDDGDFVSSTELPEFKRIKPSAHANIYLGSMANEYYDDALSLAELKVDGETEAEVKQAVETWATEQFTRIQKALRAEFALLPSTDGGTL